MPSAAVTVIETKFKPSTKAVPETTTEASGSEATAFTFATAVLTGRTTGPETGTTTPFTETKLNAVLEDLAT